MYKFGGKREVKTGYVPGFEWPKVILVPRFVGKLVMAGLVPSSDQDQDKAVKITIRVRQSVRDDLEEIAFERSEPGKRITTSDLLRRAIYEQYDQVEVPESRR